MSLSKVELTRFELSSNLHYDVIVIGAGAAGLMCAAEAGKRGRRVLLVDHSDSPGRKILVSGGGRCNFTNVHTRPENFLSANPHFAKSALARYTPSDFVSLVESYRIPYHEKKLGQLFCDRSAQDVLNLLLEECRKASVELRLACAVSEIRRTTGFEIESSAGAFSAPVLVIATGGLSIPKLGATPFGYEVAKQFGLPIVPPRPALVPLVLNQPDREKWCDLAGVAATVRASSGGAVFEERMLITHRGLSGPAILQVSSYWNGREPVRVEPLEMPQRLARRWREMQLEEAWEVIPSGTEGFLKAEVTAGGVHPDCLSSKTMESRNVPGLYFIGEVVDVTGRLGGFNFQWAWASAVAAGRAI